MNQKILLKICFKTIILILFLVSISCTENKENKKSQPNKSQENVLRLVEEEPITFPLDKETNYNVYTKLYSTNNESYLSFFNANNFSIYIYNYDSKSLYKRIQLDRDGPNGIKLGG